MHPSPVEALQRLKEGNLRFLNDLRRHRDPHDDIGKTSQHQSPFAAIVTCMDSRVATEMVFDIGIGDMFSLRMAGNVVTDGIIGSLEYATAVVGTPLIVVMGHSNCGAVKGACDGVQLGKLTGLLAHILPAIQLEKTVRGERNSQNAEFVEKVAHLNVKHAAEEIYQHSTVISKLVDRGQVAILPAMYDVATGKVNFLAALAQREPAAVLTA